jgi:deazaflavin-dependent oxidoreductase (nitroreductase family)
MKSVHVGTGKNTKDVTVNRVDTESREKEDDMVTGEDRNLRVIKEFRENSGIVGGDFEGASLLLLTTVGSHSGNKITKPLMYLPDGTRFIIFASKAGATDNPSWYSNLVANPSVLVEVGTESFYGHSETVLGVERDTLYDKQVTLYPRFGDYQNKTNRVIPVVAITRT